VVEEGSFGQEPGSGAAAVVDGRVVAVGTLEWVQRHGARLRKARPLGQRQHGKQQQQQQQEGTESSAGAVRGAVDGSGAVLAGHTQVYVSVGGAVVGLLDVADALRPDAAATVAELRAAGLRPLMLSGDRREAALAVAAAVGIPEADVHAGVKPAGKAALVAELRAEGRVVAMVGDGVNDTAALAAADVGVAMAGGVDAAADVASIVLMGDQLHQVGCAGLGGLVGLAGLGALGDWGG
jgi:Cu2+-exporting ATPase